jgi:hypothetical protein
MKETFYFSHDYGARNDPKLVKLLMVLKQEGKGVYWDIIEMLYEQGGKLLLSEIDSYAFALHTQSDTLKTVLQDFELFKSDKKYFWSESVLKRLEKRIEKSEKASNSAKKRWINASVLQTQCDSNAIKESKVKENKIKDIKVNNYPDYFQNWLEYKSDRKEKYKSDKSIKICFERLTKISNNNIETAKQIIENSIANNWAGLFEIKHNGFKEPKERKTTIYDNIGLGKN